VTELTRRARRGAVGDQETEPVVTAKQTEGHPVLMWQRAISLQEQQQEEETTSKQGRKQASS
jgi:hypothetical protein